MKLKQSTIPISISSNLLSQISAVSKKTHLTKAETMRQAIRFGLPEVEQRLSAEPAWLEQKLLEAAREPSSPMTGDDWKKLRAETRLRIEQKNANRKKTQSTR